jgi:hypothetical protein
MPRKKKPGEPPKKRSAGRKKSASARRLSEKLKLNRKLKQRPKQRQRLKMAVNLRLRPNHSADRRKKSKLNGKPCWPVSGSELTKPGLRQPQPLLLRVMVRLL